MSENKAKAVIIWIVVIFFFLIQLIPILEESEISLNPNDYARITEMDYKAVVVDEPEDGGKIVVTERITFDVHAASRDNLYWELWRDLCEDYIDGLKVHYKVNSVKQIMPDGSQVIWPESPELYWDDSDYESWNTRLGPGKWYHSPGPYNEYMQRYEAVFFYVDGLYREKVTFEIEYEMYNAVLRYGDCSDLYIAMYSGNTTKYLESLSAEILIPNKDMPKAGNYKVTTYGTSANNFPVQESDTKNPGYYTFSFDLSEDELKFNPYNEYIEFELVSYGEDKHIFADYAGRNHYYDDDVLEEMLYEQKEYEETPAKYKSIKIKIFFVCCAVAVVFIILGVGKILKMKRKYPFYRTDASSSTFRDIPSDLDPKFAAALVFAKDKKKEDDAGVYSSLLLSLARKKYVTLQEYGYGDLMITLNEEEYRKPKASEPVIDKTDPWFSGFDNPFEESSPIEPTEPEDPYEHLDSEEDDGRVYQNGYGGRRSGVSSQGRAYEPQGTLYTPYHFYEGNKSEEVIEEEPAVSEPVIEEVYEPIEPLEPLTSSEQHYLNLIKHHAREGQITMENLQDRISSDFVYTRDFVKNVQKSIVDNGVGLGYFQKANWTEPQKSLKAFSSFMIFVGIVALLANIVTYFTRIDFAFGGLFLLGFIALAFGIFVKTQAHKYVLLTELGEQEYQKWRGLYNFLSSDTLIHERTVVELPLWERYLVYATAFGIPGKVIQAIKIRCPMLAEETQSTSIVHSSYCRSGRIHTHGRHFHHSVRSGYHGYSSGGFGYGGGGRGGGGGGGGH